MTVSELLAILKNCPPDMEVEIMCGYDDHYTAGGVVSGAFVLDYRKLYGDYKYIDSTNFPRDLFCMMMLPASATKKNLVLNHCLLTILKMTPK